jgi:hypothetical protein
MNDFIEKKIAVSFANRAERIEFLKLCQEAGLMWRGGWLPTEYFALKSWLDGRQIACGYSNKQDRDLTHSRAGSLTSKGWKTVLFSEFQLEETIGVIKRNGNTITVHMGDLRGTAKCSPDDQFDLYTGCELALRRALGAEKKKPEKPKYYNGKMVCVGNGGYYWWTVGKIYEYKDGIVTADDGDKYPGRGEEPYRDAEEATHPGCTRDNTRHNRLVTMLEIKE